MKNILNTIKSKLKEQLIDTELKLKNIRKEFKNLHMTYVVGIDVDMYHAQARREQCYVEKIIALKAIMKNKKYKIKIPEGYEVVNEFSSLSREDEKRIIIELKPIKKERPKTWEELNIDIHYGYIACFDGSISYSNNIDQPDVLTWPTKELAKADRALRKLVRLRDVYNDGWKPVWINNTDQKHTIRSRDRFLEGYKTHNESCVLAFKNQEIRDEFLSNFRELINEAKLLL